MSDFDILGFNWDRTTLSVEIPKRSIPRACFPLRRSIPEFVWSLLRLDENPISYPEVMTLASGVTVGGHRLEDVQEAVALIIATKKLLALCEKQEFILGKDCFCRLHAEVSKGSALGSGVFRGEGHSTLNTSPGIRLKNGQMYYSLSVKSDDDSLSQIFSNGLSLICTLPAFERALVFFLFASLHLFFMGQNKRTAYLMMNGILMSEGFDPLILKADDLKEFKGHLLDFYESRNGTGFLCFLAKRHPDLFVS